MEHQICGAGLDERQGRKLGRQAETEAAGGVLRVAAVKRSELLCWHAPMLPLTRTCAPTQRDGNAKFQTPIIACENCNDYR